VLDDLQDLDEAERGPKAAKGRELVGVDLCHAAHDARLLLPPDDQPSWWQTGQRRELLAARIAPGSWR
jgi:hypothetical protein